MTDRLAAFKAAIGDSKYADALSGNDARWLVGEIERLRGRLRELEWAGAVHDDPCCPVCHWDQRHQRGCWLAEELGF